MSASNKFSVCLTIKKNIRKFSSRIFQFSFLSFLFLFFILGGANERMTFLSFFVCVCRSLFGLLLQTWGFYQKLNRRNYFEFVSNQISFSFCHIGFPVVDFYQHFFLLFTLSPMPANVREMKIKMFICLFWERDKHDRRRRRLEC